MIKFKIASKLSFGILLFGVGFLGMNESIFSTNLITIILHIISFLCMVWARITFGVRSFHALANTTKGKLIKTGPYRYVRHPIYSAISFFFIGTLIAYPTLQTLLGFAIIIISLFCRMLLEEKSLKETYQDEYIQYAKVTKRIVPFVI